MSIHDAAKRSHKRYRYSDKARRSVKVRKGGGCMTLIVFVALIVWWVL